MEGYIAKIRIFAGNFKPVLAIMCCLLVISCKDHKAKTINNPTPNTVGSNIVPPPSDPVAANPDTALFTTTDTAFIQFGFIASNKYIILSPCFDSSWTEGAPSLVNTEDPVYASISNVATKLVPAGYQSLLHKKFVVYGNNGVTYTATIASLKIYSSLAPYFGQVQRWQGLQDEDGKKHIYTDEEKALSIHNSGAQYLVAEFNLNAPEKKPGELVFAVPPNRPASVLFALSSNDAAGANKQQIIHALNKTKDYSAIQQEYAKANTGKGSWWQDDECNELITCYSINNKKTYTAVTHSVGDACGNDFFDQRFSVWEVEENASPVLQYMAEGFYTIILAIDIDGDNIPEFLISDGQGKRLLLKKNQEKWETCCGWEVPSNDCGC